MRFYNPICASGTSTARNGSSRDELDPQGVELGYHPTCGARPLERVIEELVITPIAARIAADATLRERDLVVEVEGGRVVLR